MLFVFLSENKVRDESGDEWTTSVRERKLVYP